MRVCAVEFGVSYLGILQPTAYSADNPASDFIRHKDVLVRRANHLDASGKYTKQCFTQCFTAISRLITNLPYMSDLHLLFNDIDDTDIFYDYTHTYERGNQRIAARIYQELVKRGLLHKRASINR
jgi:hypothetical protein